MMEAGVVVDIHDQPIFWHLPHGRSAGSLPDDRQLWGVLWDAHQRGVLKGFAHSHPGAGVPGPSWTDISTFLAIENALGRGIDWWITSADRVITVCTTINGWRHEGRYLVSPCVSQSFPWLEELRKHSNYSQEK